MTDLQIFQKVKSHLLSQMRKSVAGGSCLYRYDARSAILKCAIGCLIPDELYTHTLEHKNALGIISFLEKNGVCSRDNLPILEALQAIHDAISPVHWESYLELFAKSFDEAGRFTVTNFSVAMEKHSTDRGDNQYVM